MDVHTAATVILESCCVYKVLLDVFGPLGQGLSALLVERSSVTLQGIFVHPGVIDADFTGQICAMVSTPTPSSLSLQGLALLNLCLFSHVSPGLTSRVMGMAALGLQDCHKFSGLQIFLLSDHR